MLVKGIGRLGLFLGPLLIIVFVATNYHQGQWETLPTLASRGWAQVSSQHPLAKTASSSKNKSNDDDSDEPITIPSTHRQLFSASPSKQHFPISFTSHYTGMNHIIPHPSLPSTWIVVAQQQRSDVNNTVWFAELVCNAQFTDDGVLECTRPPTILPISATQGDGCTGDLTYFRYNIGPHDARVFYGPNIPYTMFGSQSEHTCFGQWLQDLRTLVDWGHEDFIGGHFRQATDLQRPGSYGPVEKNWFVFWDIEGKMYAHYDVSPSRVFAVLEDNGSVSRNLAPQAAARGDEQCLADYMPTFDKSKEVGQSSIHQATNSLSVTMCKRKDKGCKPNVENTFIFAIFQQKYLYDLHPVYEPYVMVYQQRTPFALHAISKRPIWINGRGKYTPPIELGKESEFVKDIAAKGSDSLAQTEMFYVTSMSWKSQGMKYHGYLDDRLFISFGIEDDSAAAIEVLAQDLLSDLGFCERVGDIV